MVRRLVTHFVVGAWIFVACACGGGETTEEPDGNGGGGGTNGGEGGDGGSGGGGGGEPVPEDLRVLPDGATFQDLVSAARRLDDRRDQESASRCLVRPAAGARVARLEADLAVAVRPLASAPEDLDERLAVCEPLRLLTRWGVVGGALPPQPLAVVAFTTTTPIAGAPAAVVLTERGARVRTAAGCPTRSLDATDDLGAAPVQEVLRAAPAIAVTAEAGVPLARVVETLERLEALGRPLLLGVVLAADTRLPAPSVPPGTDPAAGLCPDGLPVPGGEPEGDMRTETLISSLGPLRTAAQSCLASATGPGASGGRLVVGFRIGRDGRVLHACAVDDGPGDPALRACVLESVRAIQFPAPETPGYVDAQLPLVLQPDATLAQRAICR